MRALLLVAAGTLLSAGMASPTSMSRAERGAAAAQLLPDGQSFADGARLTGPAKNCVPLQDIRESRVLSDRVIDFGTGSRKKYRVVLPLACPSLGSEQRFTYATSLSQLCAQDIITVLYQTGGLQRGASCGLAPFQPIELPPRR